MAPAGTHAQVAKRISAEVAKALSAPQLRQQLDAQGVKAVGSNQKTVLRLTTENSITSNAPLNLLARAWREWSEIGSCGAVRCATNKKPR